MIKMKKTEISDKLIEKTTKEYLNNLSLLKKGFRLMLYNLGIRQDVIGLKKGEATKTNIVNMIAMQIIRNAGIDTDLEEDLYNREKLIVRSKVINFIKNNPKTKEKFSVAVKRFQKFELLGNTLIGKQLEKIGKKEVNTRKL